MAITFTLLDNGNSSTTGQTQDSNSYTPGANKLILIAIAVRNRFASPAGTVTATGNGLTWEEVNHIMYGPSTPQNNITILRSMGASPTTGVTSFTVTGAGQTAFTWQIVQADGTDTSGTNGSGAIVQSNTNNTDGSGAPFDLVVTLSALTGNNAVFAAFANDDNGTALGVKSGYTELSQDSSTATLRSNSQYKVPGDTTPTITTGTSFVDVGGVAVEIKEAGGGGGGGNAIAWVKA